jgi:AcrR family transcriptional regulator
MGRRALYSADQILDAARDLAAQSGPAAVTIAALGSALGGAPSGSLYHRFASRNELLGRLWLRTGAQPPAAWRQP